MPPKRGRGGGGGGGARGGARAASRTPGPRESTPFNPALRSQQTPGPPRFSTSYGSPAVLTGSRNYRSGGAANAISNALDSVQAADRQDRAALGEAEKEEEEESVDSLDESVGDATPKAPSTSAATVSRQTSRRGQQRAAAYESDSQDTDEEDVATRMPPPPLPFQRRKSHLSLIRSHSACRAELEIAHCEFF